MQHEQADPTCSQHCKKPFPHTNNLTAAGAVQGPQKRSVDDDNNSTWEALCTLTLWLSQLVLIPFDLAIVDSQLTDANGR